MADSSVAAYLSIVLILLFFATVWIVVFYAEPGFPWHGYLTLVLGYFSTFAILLIVPLDIAIIARDRQSTSVGSDPDYDYDIKTLSSIYDTFFTILLVLGSFLLGFLEYYNTDGYFTLGGRLWSSFKRMFIDTVGPMVVGVIILGILIGQHVVTDNISALKLAAVLVTNTMYQLGLMFLLGYALVEFPRSVWLNSDLETELTLVQAKAAQDFKDIQEASLSVSLCVSDVLKTKSQLASYADITLTQAMDILAKECPSEFRSERMGTVAANKQGQITVDTLAQLRTRLNQLKDAYKMAQAKSESTKLRAYELEDIVTAKNTPGATVIRWSLTDKDSTPEEYRWHIVIRPLLLKFAAVVCATLSLLSFLGVVCSMHGVGNEVSPYFLAVHRDDATVGGVCVFILITLGYTVYIAFWALTEMRVSATNQLVPGSTSPEALSFNVRMVARLAAPLAFFYLGWISENGIKTGSWTNNSAPDILVNTTSHNETTALNSTLLTGLVDLTQFMEDHTFVHSISDLSQNTTDPGTVWQSQAIFMPSAFSHFYQLQNVNAVQQALGTIFPIVLFVVLGLVMFNVMNRLLVLMKMGAYQFGAPIISEETLREGKRQLQRHKALTQRKFKRGDLKNFITASSRSEESLPYLKRIFFFLRKDGKKDVAADALKMPASDGPLLREPDPLSGMVEKKGGFSLSGSGWRDVYAVVHSPGVLRCYKDAQRTDALLYELDLRTALHIAVADKRSKEKNEVDLDLGTEVIKLRLKNGAEADRWAASLLAWKEHYLEHTRLYGDDLESAQNAATQPVNASHAQPAHTHAQNPMSAQNELDSIQVDEADDDEGGKRSSTAFFGFGGKASAPAPSAAPAPVKEEEPMYIEGWVEKKGGGKMGVGGDWQKRFLRIDKKNHSLVYSKSSSAADKPSGVIDLLLVQDVVPHEKNGQPDYSRFNVDTGEKVYKFRATNALEGQKWIESLNAWRDHFLLNMR